MQPGYSCALDPVSVEITYGLERIAMFIQKVDSVYDIEWTKGIKYGDVHFSSERENCIYNFDEANVKAVNDLFTIFENEAQQLIRKKLAWPAYDYALKCSHAFNILDSRGALGVTERMAYILRIRKLARECARLYLEQREELGYPLLKGVKIGKG